MQRMSIGEAFDRIDELRASLENDGLIIFPTDTIYGIGCRADSESGLLALRTMKERWGKPLSIIAPSKAWIAERFDLNDHDAWLDKLPGAFTLVLTPNDAFPEQLSPSGSVGVRIPAHPIARLVEALGFALVATSVNRAGFSPLTHPDQFSDPAYQRFCEVAFVIEDGIKNGPASTVVDLTGERPVYVRM
jgi:L-threonylcarbamoyladenylate synthase